MNKEEYISELSNCLKRLPESDKQKALEFYREYLEEAGQENETSTIEALGTPKELAKKIIVECVDKNYIKEELSESNDSNINNDSSQEAKKEKGKVKLSAIWIVLLAICALPFSQVVIALVIALLVIVISILITIGALVLSGVVTAIAGLIMFVVGILSIFSMPGGALLPIGIGLTCIALGVLMSIGFYELGKLIVIGFVKLGGSMVHKKKGGNKNA